MPTLDRWRRGRPRVRTIAVALVATATFTMTAALAASLSVGSKNLTVFRTCVVTATPTTSTADIDTFVRQDLATTNFAATVPMDVESFAANKNRRIYIKFDLTKCSPSISSSAVCQPSPASEPGSNRVASVSR